ncbi:MAG: divergent polysaccharide deacetylase family protein [Caulobacterales bacterium]
MAIQFPFHRGPSRGSGPQPGRQIGMALALFLVIGGGVVLAIQALGDPRSASPRAVVSLSPAPAAAGSADRVTFSEAALEDLPAWSELGGEETPLSELPQANGPPQAGAESGPAGTLRISVVEAGGQHHTASPLPRAPIAGLTAPGPMGPLPIIGTNGRTPSSAYARPFTSDGSKPKISIIIGGLGFNRRASTQAIEELPAEVTLSFVPYVQGLQGWIDAARADGHEVLLELPMEPFDPDTEDTGPQTLETGLTPAENIERLNNLLSRGAGYFGVTNYQGGRFAANGQAAGPVMQALRERGLLLLTTGLGQRTAMTVEARRAGLSVGAADRIIDAQQEAAAIDDQLLNLEALALQNGSAIGAGFAYPVTIWQVGSWAQELEARGYVLAPVSATLAARARGQ